jgi:hypothetical protein
MHRVVDSNMLQHPELRDYLFKSANNLAILTDYAAMEAYKGDTLASIFRSMEILAEFPKQVIILKTTGVVCGLRGRQAGLQRRMIDEKQTRDFPSYCKNLQAARLGNARLQKQLLDHGRDADAQMERILSDAADMPNAVRGIAATFSANELQLIRTGAQLPKLLVRKILENILLLAQALYSQHPRPAMVGSRQELPNTFIFRFALCAFIWVVDVISVGGGNAKPAKIRNDLIDLNFATYATYFDGLMTKDAKPLRIYHRANFVLDAITGPF